MLSFCVGSTLIYISSLLCLASIFAMSAPFENHLRSREEKESEFVFPLWSMLPAIKQREETQLLASRDDAERHIEGVGIITRELAKENNRALAEERQNEWKNPEENEESKGGELVAILGRELEEKEYEKEQSEESKKREAAAEEEENDEEEKFRSEIVSSAQKKPLIRDLRGQLPKNVENELPEMQQRKELSERRNKRELAEEEEEHVAVKQRREFVKYVRERHKDLADKIARKDSKRKYAEKNLTGEEGRYHSDEKGHEQVFTEKDDSAFGEGNNDEEANERQRKLSEEREKELSVEPKRNQERKDEGKGVLTMAESKNAVQRSRENPEELQEEETESGIEKESREEDGLLRFKDEFLPPVSFPKQWFEHQFEKEMEGSDYHGNTGREELILRDQERARMIHGEIEKELEKQIGGHKQRQRIEPDPRDTEGAREIMVLGSKGGRRAKILT